MFEKENDRQLKIKRSESAYPPIRLCIAPSALFQHRKISYKHRNNIAVSHRRLHILAVGIYTKSALIHIHTSIRPGAVVVFEISYCEATDDSGFVKYLEMFATISNVRNNTWMP